MEMANGKNLQLITVTMNLLMLGICYLIKLLLLVTFNWEVNTRQLSLISFHSYVYYYWAVFKWGQCVHWTVPYLQNKQLTSADGPGARAQKKKDNHKISYLNVRWKKGFKHYLIPSNLNILRKSYCSRCYVCMK